MKTEAKLIVRSQWGKEQTSFFPAVKRYNPRPVKNAKFVDSKTVILCAGYQWELKMLPYMLP